MGRNLPTEGDAMSTTITVGTDRLTIDVDPFTGITVSYTSAGRLTHVVECDTIAEALGVVADEVVRVGTERFDAETPNPTHH